jgi:hypothetical protein
MQLTKSTMRALDAAGNYLFHRSLVRGGYVSAGIGKSTPLGGGYRGVEALGGEANWTMDNGFGAAGGIGLAFIGPDGNGIGVGFGISYSEDCGASTDFFGGIRTDASGFKYPRKSDVTSGVDLSMGSDGLLRLGIGRGAFSTGLIIDPRRIGALVEDWKRLLR